MKVSKICCFIWSSPNSKRVGLKLLSLFLIMGKLFPLLRMESKLARQMAYKKKLEQEYREREERCRVGDMIS